MIWSVIGKQILPCLMTFKKELLPFMQHDEQQGGFCTEENTN